MPTTARPLAPRPPLGEGFTGVHRLVLPQAAYSRSEFFVAREAGTGRSVVVKTPACDSAQWLHDALEREAEVLGRVTAHPNVVTLYERRLLPDGRPALVMERCTAAFTRAHYRKQLPPPEEVVALGVRVAGALETLHNAGYVHRDVRPATVLASQFGEPVLAGFDQTVDLDDDPASYENPQLVRHAKAQTAPELLEGASATPATDVYGLASSLYELLSGQAAFRTYDGESMAVVAARVLSSRAAPITAPGVPYELADLVAWGMNPDPSQRPPSAAWFADDLIRIAHAQGWAAPKLLAR